MIIAEHIRDFVALLDSYSGGKLKEKENLTILLQLAGEGKNQNIIGELAFKGKFLFRLFQTMQKENVDSEVFEKLKAELSHGATELTDQIRILISTAPDAIAQVFERHFFMLTPEAFRHLLALAHDLYYLKNWQLELEESEK